MIAEWSLAAAKQGFYMNEAGQRISVTAEQRTAEKETILYTPAMGDALLEQIGEVAPKYDTELDVWPATSLGAVQRLIDEGAERPLCLNFASAKNPGGGFLGGAQAQEESLARSTGLYPCLLKGRGYYEANRSSGTLFYTDHIIYSPLVPIFADDAGRPLDEPRLCSFVTSPAVNKGAMPKISQPTQEQIEEVMKLRLRKILAIAHHHQHDSLVLGAWGCGVFRNDPAEVARYFEETIREYFPSSFKRIVFAIYAKGERFIKPFEECFG